MNKYVVGILCALLVIIAIPQTALAAVKYPGEACTPGTDQCTGGGVTNYICSPSTLRCDPAAFNNALINDDVSGARNLIEGTRDKNTGRKVTSGIADYFVNAAGNAAMSDTAGIGRVASLMTAMYMTKPASLPDYIASVKQNMGIPGVKDAYAQGYGYQALSPIQELWKIMRNIALAAFVVVFVIIGIMIMLRSKIDPRTVITVQQAIPKLIVALILVVFSYAICGVAIDLMTLATRVGASVLQSNGFIANTAIYPAGTGDSTKLDSLLKTNIFGLFFELYNTESVYKGITNLPADFANPIMDLLKIDQTLGNSGLTRTVVIIAIFVALIRTFFVLLEAYLKVTMTVILSPLQMLILAIPGQGKGFGDWFRGLMANLLIFPAVFFMLAFAAIFYTASSTGVADPLNTSDAANSTAYYSASDVWNVGRFIFNTNQSYWAPPALGNWQTLTGPLLALAIILTLPKVAASVREAVHPAYKPSAAEGEASKNLQSAAQKIPIVGSMLR